MAAQWSFTWSQNHCFDRRSVCVKQMTSNLRCVKITSLPTPKNPYVIQWRSVFQAVEQVKESKRRRKKTRVWGVKTALFTLFTEYYCNGNTLDSQVGGTSFVCRSRNLVLEYGSEASRWQTIGMFFVLFLWRRNRWSNVPNVVGMCFILGKLSFWSFSLKYKTHRNTFRCSSNFQTHLF